MLKAPSTLFVIACALFGASCDSSAPVAASDDSSSQTTAKRPPSLQRLTELLTADSVTQSPLKDIAAARSLADLKGVKQRVVFTEDFDKFDLKAAQWPGRTRFKKRGAGKAFVYEGSQAHQYVFVVPVQPNTHYQVRRAIKTSDKNVDLRVLETRLTVKNPRAKYHPGDVSRAKRGKFIDLKKLVTVRRYPAPPQNQWEVAELSFSTSPHTHSLAFIIDDAEAVLDARRRQVWIDDIAVVEVSPTDTQRLALLKTDRLAPGADAEIGVVKFGQHLPTPKNVATGSPFENNFDYRTALFGPAPTTFEFSVSLPAEARLDFSMGLDKTSTPGDAVDFLVEVKGPAGQWKQSFKQTLQATPQDWRWHEGTVDLSTLGGQTVSLRLSTQSQGAGYALWGDPVVSAPRQDSEPPNVLIVAVDTLRADRLSAYGHKNKTSPNIDALAEDGILFERAVSASNWTTSAFASIFTALLPSQHRVIHRARSISDSTHTFTERFAQAGWLTQAVAYKAYLYNMGFEQGFDRWFNRPKADNTADDNLKHALSFVERAGDRRFFMLFHLNDPHQPFNQPAPFDTKFTSKATLKKFGAELPITIGTHNHVIDCANCGRKGKLNPGFQKVGSDLYDGAVAFTDDRIGKLIDALKAKGIYDDTIIVVVADHGEVIWDRDNYFGHGGEQLTDELVRVPLIIKPHAGANLSPRRATSQVRTYDLAPTLLAMAGLDPKLNDNQVGASLVPLMAGPGRESAALSENVKRGVMAMSNAGWKLSVNVNQKNAPVEKLVRLEVDPGEHRNILVQEHRAAQGLRRDLIAHVLKHRPGDYLLSNAEDPIPFDMNLNGASPQVWFGQGLTGKRHQVQGKLKGWMLIKLGEPVAQLAPPARWKLEDLSLAEGLLALDKTFPKKTIYRIKKEAEAPSFAAKEAVDAEQIETLKALGYIE